MGPSFAWLLVIIFACSEAFSVVHTWTGNTQCQGTPTSITLTEAACVPANCTMNGGDSSIVQCGPLKAIVNFSPSADAGISGSVTFTQINSTYVSVALNVTGITTNPDGMHGMHVHQYGDLRGFIPGAGINVTKAASVGSHWNPSGNNHSCPELVRHDGDLGNWNAVGGSVVQTKEISGITLIGSKSIIGHAVVFHATVDDCAATLSAGARLATGVVGIANVAGNLAYADVFSAGTDAVCVFVGTTLNNFPIGTAGLAQLKQEGGFIHIRAHTIGVPGGIDGQIGFHSHTYGDLSDVVGGSVGGHWNLDNAVHGLPTVNAARHLGDFGTIRVNASNHGYYDFTPTDYTPAASLKIANFLGHAIVIHADIDHGNEPTCAGASSTGAAGARALFCVLGVPNPADPATPGFFLESIDTTGMTLNNTWANVPCAQAPQPEPQPEPEPEPAPETPPPAPVTIPINQAGLFPENFEWDPFTSQFITGSLTAASLYHIDMQGTVTLINNNPDFAAVSGVHVYGNQLVACYGVNPGTIGAIRAWNIEANPWTELWTVLLNNTGDPTIQRFCNDLTTDPAGHVYATDSLANIIYKVTVTDGNAVASSWSDSPLYKGVSFQLDGIVYKNNYLIIGKIGTSQLIKLPIMDDGSAGVPAVIPFGDVPVPVGPDGLAWMPDGRLAVSHSAGVVLLSSTDDWGSVSASSDLQPSQYQSVQSRMVTSQLYVLESNLTALFAGDFTSQQFDFLVVSDCSYLNNCATSNKGWIAAVVIILLVVFIIAGIAAWYYLGGGNSGERF